MLEDEVHLFIHPFEAPGLPQTPIKILTITPADKQLAIIEVFVEEQYLVNGRFRVSCHLKDRSGNLNRYSEELHLTIDLEGQAQTFAPIRPIAPYVSIFGWINCASLEQVRNDAAISPPPAQVGLKFRVPLPQEGVNVGDRVELAWRMAWDRHGEEVVSDVTYLPAVALPASGELLMPRINQLLLDEMDKVIEFKRTRIELLRRKQADGSLTEAELIENAGKLSIALEMLRKLVGETGVTNPPMEGSVRVGYRVQTASGQWGSAQPYNVFVSLQRPGNVICNERLGPWLKTIP